MTGRIGIEVRATGAAAEAWAGFREGRLPLQRCEASGHFRHPPAEGCPRCGDRAWHWEDAAGTGTIYSFTTVHHAVHPIVESWLPYTVVLVDLDEGPRMVSRYVGATDPAVGLRVAVRFEEHEDLTIPVFAAMDDPPGG